VKWFKHYYYYYTLQQERRGKRKSCFAEWGKSNSRRCCLCCWCNDVIAIMSHHVHTHTDGQNDQSLSLLQCSLRSPWRNNIEDIRWKHYVSSSLINWLIPGVMQTWPQPLEQHFKSSLQSALLEHCSQHTPAVSGSTRGHWPGLVPGIAVKYRTCIVNRRYTTVNFTNNSLQRRLYTSAIEPKQN